MDLNEIVSLRTHLREKPGEDQLRKLPDRKALIKGRLSSPSQVRDSKESVREIASLVDIAKADGFKTNLNSAEILAWLEEIKAGRAQPGVKADGEVIVNCLGLGVSGTLPENMRPDLLYDMDLLEKSALGAIYVTEGANRLSRDPDRITSAKLLKAMKDTNCKLRTPDEILNPRVEHDWDIIHDELERGAEELKGMGKRLHRRKENKAKRGEFVGEPVPAGFFLPIVERKSDGRYLFGKMQRYDTHAAVVDQILREFVRQGGSALKTAQSLRDVAFPSFPAELAYMERVTALRACSRTASRGYRLTPAMVKGLATNPKLAGIWEWGNVVIPNNHDHAVDDNVFLPAYQLATEKGKPRGRATHHESLEWSGLLQCLNHPNPRMVNSHSSSGEYCCQRDYMSGQGKTCLDVNHRLVDQPLTTEVLRHLVFTPHTEEIISKLETEAALCKLGVIRRHQEFSDLQRKLENLRSNLGSDDPEMEGEYREQIRITKQQMEQLQTRPVLEAKVTAVDIRGVRDFLTKLPETWETHSKTLRNRLLKLVIDRVELRHDKSRMIATIFWRTGFHQEITILRPTAKSGREKRWSDQDNSLLKMLWTSSSREDVLAAFPGRSWTAISLRALRLDLRRSRQYHAPNQWRPWNPEEDNRLKSLYEDGVLISEIANRLARTVDAIETRAAAKKLSRPATARWKLAEVNWVAHDLVPMHAAPSEI